MKTSGTSQKNDELSTTSKNIGVGLILVMGFLLLLLLSTILFVHSLVDAIIRVWIDVGM